MGLSSRVQPVNMSYAENDDRRPHDEGFTKEREESFPQKESRPGPGDQEFDGPLVCGQMARLSVTGMKLLTILMI